MAKWNNKKFKQNANFRSEKDILNQQKQLYRNLNGSFNSSFGAGSNNNNSSSSIGSSMSQQKKRQQQPHHHQQQLHQKKHWQQQQINTGVRITVKNHNNNAQRYVSRDEIQAQRNALPITGIRDQIVTELRKEKTIILIGETASGKTTQIPQFVHTSGCMDAKGIIAVTQPRRVAAISIATRVAGEMNCQLGQTVGYCVRFDDKTSESTKIKYMTDGMLLREAITDPLLTKYSMVILDEAHERSIQTDVLFGIVKRCQQMRSGNNRLKIVVMSATMDVDHFRKYFDDAPVLYLEGRQFPITTYYSVKHQDDYVDAAIVTVLQIHREFDDGDILVFCSGQEEINSLIATLRSAIKNVPAGVTTSYPGPILKMMPFALHASLPQADQIRVFQPMPKGTRKVIFATNVAETSLTIPGVKFVVDTCRVKCRSYDPETGFESLKVELISKAQASQRSGRAGREGPGTAYRLLTEEEFCKLKDFSVPEILRVSLANVMLHLIAIGINDVLSFDFLDRPKLTNFESAIRELEQLGAISQEDNQEGNLLTLTPIGKEMVIFPLEPKYSKILIASQEFGCVDEILIIIALLTVDNIFYITPQRREAALESMKKFKSSEGDIITLLKVYRGYQSSKFSRDWCIENFIIMRNMEIVREIRQQLARLWHRSGHRGCSCGEDYYKIRHCMLAGFGENVAILDRDGVYRRNNDKKEVFIHPSSSLFQSKPEAITYTQLVDTSKLYMRNISLISIDWLSSKSNININNSNNNTISNTNDPDS